MNLEEQYFAASDPRSDPDFLRLFNRMRASYHANDAGADVCAHADARAAVAAKAIEGNRARTFEDAAEPFADEDRTEEERQKQIDATNAQAEEVHQRALASFGGLGISHVQQPVTRKRMIG
jgi:hypothetical protein